MSQRQRRRRMTKRFYKADPIGLTYHCSRVAWPFHKRTYKQEQRWIERSLLGGWSYE